MNFSLPSESASLVSGGSGVIARSFQNAFGRKHAIGASIAIRCSAEDLPGTLIGLAWPLTASDGHEGIGCRGYVAEQSVRPQGIVMAPPALYDGPRLSQ
jgi:hypothetical protein